MFESIFQKQKNVDEIFSTCRRESKFNALLVANRGSWRKIGCKFYLWSFSKNYNTEF